MAKSYREWITNSQFALGAQSIAMSLQEAADFMLTNLHVARYWRRKVTDRDYHADTWGGARTYRFSENDRFLLHFAVYSKTLETPTITALEMLVYLRDELEFEALDGEAGRRWINRVWERWGWTSKHVCYRNINKYSNVNVEYYVLYRAHILTVPLEDLIFYDETSFAERDLHRKRARSRKGRPAFAHKSRYGPAAENQTFNCGVMMSLRLEKGYAILNEETEAQTSLNFIEAMIYAVEQGIVRRGSVVVLDNAPTHMSVESLIFVYELFETVGARIVLLPTYSPELNPCELLFAMFKNRLYRARGSGSLLQEVGRSCQLVTWENCFDMYFKCIFEAVDEF
jgi:transposase